MLVTWVQVLPQTGPISLSYESKDWGVLGVWWFDLASLGDMSYKFHFKILFLSGICREKGIAGL